MLHLVVFLLLFNLTYPSLADPPGFLVGVGPQPISHHVSETNANLATSETANKHDSVGETSGKPQNPPAAAGVQLNLPNNPFSGEKQDVSRQAQKSSDVNQNTEKLNKAEIQHGGSSNNNNKHSDEQHSEISNSKNAAAEESSKSKQAPNKNATSVNKTLTAPIPVPPKPKEDIMQSGAFLRGFYVFLGLSAITMVYFLFRSYRLRHGSQPSTTVKKYGITARRSDMEMRPLELDDDDDDTLFEINNQSANR